MAALETVEVGLKNPHIEPMTCKAVATNLYTRATAMTIPAIRRTFLVASLHHMGDDAPAATVPRVGAGRKDGDFLRFACNILVDFARTLA